MGRWSDVNVEIVDQETDKTKCAEIKLMSGDDGRWLLLRPVGMRVGRSALRTQKEEFSISVDNLSPRSSVGRIPGLTVGVPIAHNKGVSWGVVEDGSKVGSVVSGEDVG